MWRHRFPRRVGWLGAILSFLSIQSLPALAAARADGPRPGRAAPARSGEEGPFDRVGAELIDQVAFWREAFGLELVPGAGGLVLAPAGRESEWHLYAGASADPENLVGRTAYVEIDRVEVDVPLGPPVQGAYASTGAVRMLDGTWRPVTMLLLRVGDERRQVDDAHVVAPLAFYADEGDALLAAETWRAFWTLLVAPGANAPEPRPGPDPARVAPTCMSAWAACRDDSRRRWSPLLTMCLVEAIVCLDQCRLVRRLCRLFGVEVPGPTCDWVCAAVCATAFAECVLGLARQVNRSLGACDGERRRCEPGWEPQRPI